MADLTGKTLANGYPNLVTIGATTNDNPTTGTLENGKGNNLTSVTFDGAVVVNESGGNNDFRVEGDTDQNLLFVDASTDRVGIGSNSPSGFLEVNSGTGASYFTRSAGDDGTNSPAFGIATASSDVRLASSGDLALRVGAVGTTALSQSEVARFTSDGLTFNGDTAAANALDDYEEGTWTPVYVPQTGTFTTMTMDVISATYTKIGRQVTVIVRVQTDEVVVGTAGGELRIAGLPFANTNQSGISVGLVRNWSNAPDSGIIEANQSYIKLQKTNATANINVADLTTGAVADQNLIILTATYFV